MHIGQTRLDFGTRRRGRYNTCDDAGASELLVRGGERDVYTDVRQRPRDRSLFKSLHGKHRNVSYIVRVHAAVRTWRVGTFDSEVPCAPGSVRWKKGVSR